jgi:hypothetical protein
MSVREADDPQLFARIQEQNLLRQYDLLANCVEIGLKKGIEAFDKYTLWSLNAAAVANIAQFGGRFREQPIYVGNHIPPHFKEVSNLVDQFISVLHEIWTIEMHPTVLPAYALWRLNGFIRLLRATDGRLVQRVICLSVSGKAYYCPARRLFLNASARIVKLTMTRSKPPTDIGRTETSTLRILPSILRAC